jgi:hypothetical protein
LLSLLRRQASTWTDQKLCRASPSKYLLAIVHSPRPENERFVPAAQDAK